MTFCVEVKRESEEDYIFHFNISGVPDVEYVTKLVLEEEINYNEEYESFTFYRVD